MGTVLTTTQTYLERLSLRLAGSAGDETMDYTADGITLLAYQRESVINRAVKDMYENIFSGFLKEFNNDLQLAAGKMMKTFQCYQSFLIFTISHFIPDSTALVKPLGDAGDQKIRLIKDVSFNTVSPLIQNVTAQPLDPDNYNWAKTEKYSNYRPTYKAPRFYETEKLIEVMFDTLNSKVEIGTLKALCLLQPVYQKFDRTGSDIIAPVTWESQIIEDAKKLAYSIKQK